MGKHEIRMRRQRLTTRGTERFRNYGAVLKQHEEEKRMKKIVRVFVFFLLIALVIVLIMMVNKWEKKTEQKKIPVTSYQMKARFAKINT
jgi:NADH:ubiquinone oxidoreductase subunit 6 (subunit J)